jgi:hypothetical protein
MRAARSAQKEMQVRLGGGRTCRTQNCPTEGLAGGVTLIALIASWRNHIGYRWPKSVLTSRNLSQLLASHGGAKTTSSAVIVSKS